MKKGASSIVIGAVVLVVIVAIVFFSFSNSSEGTYQNSEESEDIGGSELAGVEESGKVCGNNNCESGEAYEICPQDCPRIDPQCSNGVCEGGESYESCPQDCSLQDILGTNANDGACQPGEDIDNAPNDCTDIQPNCGNAICDTWETKKTCYEDCPFDAGEGESEECDYDSDCSYKEICRSDKCTRVDCTNDAHCSSGKKCESNRCVSCGSGPYGSYC